MAVIAVTKPTIVAVPSLFHSPLFENLVKTVFASLIGASAQSGIMMMKRPATWRMSTNASTKGSFFARKVLKMTAKRAIAIVIRVPCHRSKT